MTNPAAGLLFSKVILGLLVVVAVAGAVRGRLRLRLRVDPHVRSRVPTTWAVGLGAGPRLHRRLRAACHPLGEIGRPPKRRLGRPPAATAAQRSAAEALAKAVDVDHRLARAARTEGPASSRLEALRALAPDVAEVEQLAGWALDRARAEQAGVIDASATVGRLGP